jgi:DNA repair exonuclease SbcCD nuclease subunit
MSTPVGPVTRNPDSDAIRSAVSTAKLSSRVQLIGDPHLGKSFMTGVPLHRVGEREASQRKQFEKLILKPAQLTIVMGDLFDKFVISLECLLDTANKLNQASEDKTKQIVILRGNHDLSRDVIKKSSFEVLKLLVTKPNVHFIDTIREIFVGKDKFLMVPYDAFKTGKELLEDWMTQRPKNQTYRYEAVFGHWDIHHFGGKEAHNMVPLFGLSHLTDLVVTGHIHECGVYTFPGFDLTVLGTGSMQPYAHGEDATGEVYVTLTQAQAEATPKTILFNKCVRILMKRGESLPEIDCLQLIAKFEDEVEGDQNLEVELIDFDLMKLWDTSMQTVGVTDEKIISEVHEMYRVIREG